MTTLSRRPCNKPGHVLRYFDGRCITCHSEKKRHARLAAGGLTESRSRVTAQILNQLGKASPTVPPGLPSHMSHAAAALDHRARFAAIQEVE